MNLKTENNVLSVITDSGTFEVSPGDRNKFIEYVRDKHFALALYKQVMDEFNERGYQVEIPAERVRIEYMCCRKVGTFSSCDRQCANDGINMAFFVDPPAKPENEAVDINWHSINEFVNWVNKNYKLSKGGYRMRGDFHNQSKPRKLESLKDEFIQENTFKQSK